MAHLEAAEVEDSAAPGPATAAIPMIITTATETATLAGFCQQGGVYITHASTTAAKAAVPARHVKFVRVSAAAAAAETAICAIASAAAAAAPEVALAAV